LIVQNTGGRARLKDAAVALLESKVTGYSWIQEALIGGLDEPVTGPGLLP
jgi:hypothetical protein